MKRVRDPSLLVIVDLVLSSPTHALSVPTGEEPLLVKNVLDRLRPFPENFPAVTVDGPEAAQLSELLRELRDFR